MTSLKRSLQLLNFVVTQKESDEWYYTTYLKLKTRLTKQDRLKIISALKSNPQAYSGKGLVNYLITESNAQIHSVQWSY